jgi:hypothetical protein
MGPCAFRFRGSGARELLMWAWPSGRGTALQTPYTPVRVRPLTPSDGGVGDDQGRRVIQCASVTPTLPTNPSAHVGMIRSRNQRSSREVVGWYLRERLSHQDSPRTIFHPPLCCDVSGNRSRVMI